MGIKVSGQNTKHGYAFFITWVFLITSFLSTVTAAAEVKTDQELKQYISASMSQLVTKLTDNNERYKKDNDLFYNDLNIELSKLIDFRRIALKVMGKYGRQASKAQRAQFVDRFKQSLYRTYAQVLLENKAVEISVINATLNPRNANKGKVNMEVKSAGGSNYEISYSLHKGKDKTYRVENIVVMGINLGLAYKDRFQQQFKEHKGNIKSVIDNWTFDGAA
ncbi:MAG: phospholipid transport system substrate-binding protein [Oleiphilaceae bacterium]|jgi:phospholipid transport system substrate-binding protein